MERHGTDKADDRRADSGSPLVAVTWNLRLTARTCYRAT